MTARSAARGLLVVVLLTWFALPLLPLALWAVAESWGGQAPLPQRWGLGGFRAATTPESGTALVRSAALGAAVAALATPAGAAAARALTLRTLRRPRLVAALLLAPVALPAFAVAMGLDVVLLWLRVPGPLGVLLILTVTALPYTTYVLYSAYSSYDVTVEEEAVTLGAGPRSVRWRVRLPLLAPGVAAAAFLAFLVGWTDYIVTLLVGGGQFVTVPLLVASAASGSGNEAAVAAMSLSAVAPPVLVLGLTLLAGRRTSARPPRDSARRRESASWPALVGGGRA